MNDQISWDQALIKKYSSSNHFKLLTQLKNEVKKYPLNNKKNIVDQSDSNRIPISNKLNNSVDKEFPVTKTSEINTDLKNKSTVSFNNSKNFSIYKNISNTSKMEEIENKQLDIKESKEDLSKSTFKDRLNQVDMK